MAGSALDRTLHCDVHPSLTSSLRSRREYQRVTQHAQFHHHCAHLEPRRPEGEEGERGDRARDDLAHQEHIAEARTDINGGGDHAHSNG